MVEVGREEILVDTKQEATKVVNGIKSLIKKNGVATVAQFHILAKKANASWYDRLGWNNVDDAIIKKTTWGFLIRMPACFELEEAVW